MTSQPSNAAEPSWGFTRPECRGEAALLLFMADLARAINQYFTTGQATQQALNDAQKAVDALLQRYVEIQAAPAAFEHQQIVLRLESEQRADGSMAAPQVALHMSPYLENLIIEAQRQAHLDAAATATH